MILPPSYVNYAMAAVCTQSLTEVYNIIACADDVRDNACEDCGVEFCECGESEES